jgi:hypothetical protein
MTKTDNCVFPREAIFQKKIPEIIKKQIHVVFPAGAGPPDRPREPKVVVKSATTLKVSWDQPINNGALISSYRSHALILLAK